MADLSMPVKIALVLFGLGFFFHVIGFAAPYWHVHEWSYRGTDSKVNYGLWRFCHDQYSRAGHREACGNMMTGTYGTDYIRAAQFFETVGFLAAVVSLVLLLLAMCITSCRDRRILPILSAICALGAAGCIILGCIIFGAKDQEKNHLSWAFALALIGGIFFAVAGVIVLIFTVIKKGVTAAV